MIGTDQKAAFPGLEPVFLKTGVFKVAAFSGFQINKTVFFRRNLLPLNLFLMMRYISPTAHREAETAKAHRG